MTRSIHGVTPRVSELFSDTYTIVEKILADFTPMERGQFYSLIRSSEWARLSIEAWQQQVKAKVEAMQEAEALKEEKSNRCRRADTEKNKPIEAALDARKKDRESGLPHKSLQQIADKHGISLPALRGIQRRMKARRASDPL